VKLANSRYDEKNASHFFK